MQQIVTEIRTRISGEAVCFHRSTGLVVASAQVDTTGIGITPVALGAITLPGSAITFAQLSPPLLSDPEFVFDGDGGGTKEVCIWGGWSDPLGPPNPLRPRL